MCATAGDGDEGPAGPCIRGRCAKGDVCTSGGAINRTATVTAVLVLLLGPAPEASAAAPRCGGRRATHVGTNAANILRGTDEMDTFVAYGGRDRVLGYNSGDRACLGAGADVARLSGHTDYACSGKGADRLYGSVGFDDLYGQRGNDRLYGGEGADQLYGGAGAGYLLGTGAEQGVWPTDGLYGGPGDDVLDARGGAWNVVVGGPGYDTCYAVGGPGFDGEPDEVRGCEEATGAGEGQARAAGATPA